jgi:hypothetical protein
VRIANGSPAATAIRKKQVRQAAPLGRDAPAEREPVETLASNLLMRASLRAENWIASSLPVGRFIRQSF